MKSVSDYTFPEPLVPGDTPVVTQAMSRNTGKFVAIKYFPPALINTIEPATMSRSLAIFSSMRHPNIVPYHEVIHNNYGVFIVMDYCEGKSLANTLEQFGCCLTEELVAQYTYQILQGLLYLHKQGNIHGNLKASNVLLSTGTIKLTDFGLSADIRNRKILENPYWHAPEVLETKTFSKASDVWSVGCVIIELLTGRPPFKDCDPEDARMRIINEPMPIPPNASQHLVDFLSICFNRDPDQRPKVDDLFDFFWVKKVIPQQQTGNHHRVESRLKIHLPAPNKKTNVRLDDMDFDVSERPMESEKPPTSSSSSGDGTKLTKQDSIKRSKLPEKLKSPRKLPETKTTAPSKPAQSPSTKADLKVKSLIASNEKKPPLVASGLNAFKEDDDNEGAGFSFANKDGSVSNTIRIKPNQANLVDLNNIGLGDDEDSGLFARLLELDELKKKILDKLLALRSDMNKEELANNLREILDILTKEPMVRNGLVAQQGILPLIEVIEFDELSTETTTLVLQIIEKMIQDFQLIKESICLLGGLPPIMQFYDESKWPAEIREMALRIIYDIIEKSSDNTQMFIASDGVKAIVKALTLTTDTFDEKIIDIIVINIKTISTVFKQRCGIQVADFSRLFTKGGLIPPLSSVLLKLVDMSEEMKEGKLKTSVLETLDSICELFHTISQADIQVKQEISEVEVMKRIVSTMMTPEGEVRHVLSHSNTIFLCKTIRLISMEDQTRDNLTKAGVMEMTCQMLKVDFGAAQSATLYIHSNLIMILQDMVKLSLERISIVAESGILTHLKPYLETETELKSLTLYVILALPTVASKDKENMRRLIDDGLIEIFLNNLSQPYWGARVISAITPLLNEESFGVMKKLMENSSLDKIRSGIDIVNAENAPTMIQKLTDICKKSKEFMNALLDDRFANILQQKFQLSLNLPLSSQIPIAILELIDVLISSSVPNSRLLRTDEIKEVAQNFLNTGNMKQKAFAKSIISAIDE